MQSVGGKPSDSAFGQLGDSNTRHRLKVLRERRRIRRKADGHPEDTSPHGQDPQGGANGFMLGPRAGAGFTSLEATRPSSGSVSHPPAPGNTLASQTTLAGRGISHGLQLPAVGRGTLRHSMMNSPTPPDGSHPQDMGLTLSGNNLSAQQHFGAPLTLGSSLMNNETPGNRRISRLTRLSRRNQEEGRGTPQSQPLPGSLASAVPQSSAPPNPITGAPARVQPTSTTVDSSRKRSASLRSGKEKEVVTTGTTTNRRHSVAPQQPRQSSEGAPPPGAVKETVISHGRIMPKDSVHSGPEVNIVAEVGVSEESGRRPYMEDRHDERRVSPSLQLFGVYDGHGGALIAEYCRRFMFDNILGFYDPALDNGQEALRSGILKTESDWMATHPNNRDGTTVAVTMICGTSMFFGWVGDSRIIVLGDGSPANACLLETEDHKPGLPREEERIYKAGGAVRRLGPVPRLWPGSIAVSRSLGDRHLKADPNRKPLIPDPEIIRWEVTPKAKYVVIASDGLWDVLDARRCAEIVRQHGSCAAAAKSLVKASYDAGSGDNITATVVRLAPPK